MDLEPALYASVTSLRQSDMIESGMGVRARVLSTGQDHGVEWINVELPDYTVTRWTWTAARGRVRLISRDDADVTVTVLGASIPLDMDEARALRDALDLALGEPRLTPPF